MLELKTVGGECFKPYSDDIKHVYRTKAYIEYLLTQESKVSFLLHNYRLQEINYKQAKVHTNDNLLSVSFQEQANLKHCSCENPKKYKEFISNIWTLVQKLNSRS